MSNPISVTESACAYLNKMLAAKPDTIFRLSIKKTGCSGYSYFPEIANEPRSSDTAMRVNDSITIYLDTTWLHLLNGITMDYVEEEKIGLKQKRLLFINPKESGRCGCGESFHVSNDDAS